MTPDVVVVGAGPAGAAVSIMLAQRGYRVLLLDRATFPRDKPCAEYLSPACSPLLEHLGVLQAVLAAVPQQLQGMRSRITRASRVSGVLSRTGNICGDWRCHGECWTTCWYSEPVAWAWSYGQGSRYDSHCSLENVSAA